jgi:hypothetical protein
MRHRCDLKGSRNEGVVATVSALALIVLYPMLGSGRNESPSHRGELADWLADILADSQDGLRSFAARLP